MVPLTLGDISKLNKLGNFLLEVLVVEAVEQVGVKGFGGTQGPRLAAICF